MKALLVPVAAALTVAGCSSGPDRIDAGEWSMSTEVLSIEGPGVSDAMSEAAASQPPQTASTCVTEEMAANDFGGLLNQIPFHRLDVTAGNHDQCVAVPLDLEVLGFAGHLVAFLNVSMSPGGQDATETPAISGRSVSARSRPPDHSACRRFAP